MSQYAVVIASVVQNVIEWDGDTTEWQPPSGTTAPEVTSATGPAYIGGVYADGIFVPAPTAT